MELSLVVPVYKEEKNIPEFLRRIQPILDGVANTLQAQPGVNISVDGYTDNRGDAKRNVDLSQRRAKSVVDYLVSKGIDAKRLSAQGHGADSPIDSNKTAAGRANNRRVELNVK